MRALVRGAGRRTAWTLACTVVALALVAALSGPLGGIYFAVPLALVAGLAMHAGTLPGAVATTLVAAGIGFAAFEPRWTLALPEREAGLRLLLFWAAGLIISGVAGAKARVRIRLAAERAAARAAAAEAERSAEAERRSSAALRESEERFRALADNIAQLAWMTDSRGDVVWFNERWYAYTGTTAAQMIGRGWREVHHPDHVERVIDKISRAFAAGEPWEDTFPLRGRDGTYRWFLSRATPIRDEDGAVLRWFGTNTDVTAERDAALALEEAHHRKDQFLGVLSHELRNPLAPIRTAVEILDRVPPGGPEAARARAIIGRQADHLTRLVDDLLDVTRISRGKIQLRRAWVDLAEIVRRAADDFRDAFRERGIRLDVDAGPGPVRAEADATRVAQVIGNLLQNAVKFTPRGGSVDLSLTLDRAAGCARIRVRDTGVGIAPEMLGAIFEPFVQADETLHRSQGGLGLGLALVKGLVELHGGDVSVRSAGHGTGAEFTVTLRAVALAAVVPPGEERMPEPARVRRRVLVIEDNRDAAETLRMLLEMMDHEVEVVHDGRAGVERARAARPDVVLCDIGLPELDGYEVAREIRASANGGGPLLVALSGYALPEDRRRAAEAGFDRHLAKPVRIEEIEAVLRMGATPAAMPG